MELEHRCQEVALVAVSRQIFRIQFLLFDRRLVIAADNRLSNVTGTANGRLTQASGAFLDSITLPVRAVATQKDDDNDEGEQTGGNANSRLNIDFESPHAEQNLILPSSGFNGASIPIGPCLRCVDTPAFTLLLDDFYLTAFFVLIGQQTRACSLTVCFFSACVNRFDDCFSFIRENGEPGRGFRLCLILCKAPEEVRIVLQGINEACHIIYSGVVPRLHPDVTGI